MKLWLFLTLLPFVTSAKKVTTEENESLMSFCGEHFLGDYSTLKAFGGRTPIKREFPWIVAITFGGPAATNQCKSYCTGALISPRHVLTAAHCLVKTRRQHLLDETLIRKSCQGHRNTRQYVSAPESTFVYVGGECDKRFTCPGVRTNVDKMYVYEGFDECSGSQDMALIELTQNVPSSIASPICLPRAEPSQNIKIAGFGRPGPHKKGLKSRVVVDGFLQHVIRDFFEITLSPNAGICPGDSGGPVFQMARDSRFTLVGVHSGGNTCDIGFKGYKFVIATNVRSFLHWICDNTGICPTEAGRQPEK